MNESRSGSEAGPAPNDSPRAWERVLPEIEALPKYWHAAGPMSGDILRAIARHCPPGGVERSVETGSGKSTLLLSHLSSEHTVFSIDDGNGNLQKVLASPLLKRESVRLVEGPTQRTLPAHRFAGPIHLALIDGPHGYPFPDLEYFYIYPHLAPQALLVLDDIHIRSIHNLFEFLKADDMFELEEVVRMTALFRRTEAPTFDPFGDEWWLQGYNRKLVWVDRSLVGTLKHFVPSAIKERIKQHLGR